MRSVTRPPEHTKRIWLVTGEPGSGKSTTVSKTLFHIRSKGFTVGGVLTREIRSHGEREGFRLVDLSSEESEVLASVTGITGPKIGKYRVNLKALSGLGTKALMHASDYSDLIVCDEVGPMELLSPEFKREIHHSVIESNKPCICVVHKRYSEPIIDELRSSPESTEVEVTFENRDEIAIEIAGEILEFLNLKVE